MSCHPPIMKRGDVVRFCREHGIRAGTVRHAIAIGQLRGFRLTDDAKYLHFAREQVEICFHLKEAAQEQAARPADRAASTIKTGRVGPGKEAP